MRKAADLSICTTSSKSLVNSNYYDQSHSASTFIFFKVTRWPWWWWYKKQSFSIISNINPLQSTNSKNIFSESYVCYILYMKEFSRDWYSVSPGYENHWLISVILFFQGIRKGYGSKSDPFLTKTNIFIVGFSLVCRPAGSRVFFYETFVCFDTYIAFSFQCLPADWAILKSTFRTLCFVVTTFNSTVLLHLRMKSFLP